MRARSCWCASTERQWRHLYWRSRQAGWNPGESPEDAVIRELQEETGHTADTLKHLQSFYMSPGYCTEEMHAFLATDLRPAVLDPDFDEDIEVVRVPINEISALLQSGQVRDAKSITTLLLALRALPGNLALAPQPLPTRKTLPLERPLKDQKNLWVMHPHDIRPSTQADLPH